MIATATAITLRWLGQACFLIMGMQGTHPILIDPPNPSVGYAIQANSIPAAAVFVSHEHPDHNWTQAASGTPTIVQPISAPAPEVFGAIGDSDFAKSKVHYERIFAYHDNVQGAKRGPDTITILHVNGLTICHLGDLGELNLTPEQLKAIGKVDVLMIPVGGYYTIDATQATEIIREINPRVIIPMHYQTPALSPQLQSLLHPITEFETAMTGKAQIVHVDTRDLKLSESTLPKTQTVYILKYQ